MAKNSIRDYSATNSSNTDIQSIDISEGCSPAGINNAIREIMADLKDVSTGAVALESPAFDSASLTGDLTFGDNDKAIFGAGSDLQIYHDGSTSYIKDAGTGNLIIEGANTVIDGANGNRLASFVSGGRVELQYDGSEKLRTTATGVDVTGTVTATGLTSTNNGVTLQSASVTKSALNVASTTNQGINGTAAGDQYNWTTGGKMLWSTNSGTTAHLVLDSSGNLLVGTTSPIASGRVSAQATGTSPAIVAQGVSDCFQGRTTQTSGNSYFAYWVYNGSAVGSITSTGTTTAYNTSSDYRLKTAVTYDWDATTRLKQLRPARFEWISDGDDAVPVDGFLAHEVQDVVPESITGTKDAMRDEEYQVSAATGDIYTPAIEAVLDEDGNEVTPAVAEVIHSTDVERPEELAEGQQWRETTAAVMGTRSVPDYQGIDQSKLVPLLVKTIQELEARITALEAN